jgi:antitoxin (DNA-binding transcriptional repressor) of toxin-antitoxin stability system
MSTVTVHTAKKNLSKLLAQVEAGEESVFARGNTPVAWRAPIFGAPQDEVDTLVVSERRRGGSGPRHARSRISLRQSDSLAMAVTAGIGALIGRAV